MNHNRDCYCDEEDCFECEQYWQAYDRYVEYENDDKFIKERREAFDSIENGVEDD